MKLLYFMRIFRSTSYLIRMIICVIADMKIFILLLLTTILAFGDAFQTIAKANKDVQELDTDGNVIDYVFVSGFINSFLFTYRMILGDFDTSDFGSVSTALVTFFWLLCTLFNMIIMLNLLISIVGEAFGSVNSNSEPASYKEMAGLIAENAYLIPDSEKESYA